MTHHLKKGLSLMGLALLVAAQSPEEYKEVEPLPGKVKAMVPKYFVAMPDFVKEMRYGKATAPQVVYTNAETSVNLTFTLEATEANAQLIPQFVAVAEQQMRQQGGGQVLGSGEIQIDGQPGAYLEFAIQAPQGRIYNYMLYTVVEGQLLIVSFNCLEALEKEWVPKGKGIIASLKIMAP